MVSLSSLLGPWTDTWPPCTKDLASKASCSPKLFTKPIELHIRQGERAAFHPTALLTICAEGGKRSQLIDPFIVHQQGRCNGTMSADKSDFLDNRWHADVSPADTLLPCSCGRTSRTSRKSPPQIRNSRPWMYTRRTGT